VSGSYSEADRAAAVEIFRIGGSNEAHRQTGISESTIRRWAHERGVRCELNGINAAASEAARIRAEKLREELRLRILDKAADVLSRMDSKHTDKKALPDGTVVDLVYDRPTPSGVREYAVAFGILLDKYRLELGEHTGREKHEVDVHQYSEEQIERDIARIASVRPIRSAKSG